MDLTKLSKKSSISNITHELLKLAEKPGFDYALEQFERIRFAAELLVDLSSTGTASESESEQSNKKPTTSRTVRKRKNPVTILEESDEETVEETIEETVEESIEETVEETVEDDMVFTAEIITQKKRKPNTEIIPYTGIYLGHTYDLKQIKFLHIIPNSDISAEHMEKILSLDTFLQNSMYSEWSAYLLNKNLILPIGSAKIYELPGYTSNSLDNFVLEFLTRSVQAGVWKLVENIPQGITPDSKKYFTYRIDDIAIKKYKLRKPRF